MEWVETTARTVAEAKDAALDQLGVDEQDAEFDILEEPRTGLFGRSRGEARVRARVRPTQPRPKVEQRDRRGSGRERRPGTRSGNPPRSGARKGGGSDAANDRAGAPGTATTAAPAIEGAPTGSPERSAPPGERAVAGVAPGSPPRPPQGRGRQRSPRSPHPAVTRDDDQETPDMTDVELAEQGEVVRGFLIDLLDAFGLDGDVSATPAEEGAVELAVAGGDLGLLIGPKGATLQAVQELSRSVLQRQLPDTAHARIRVDVSGYRAKRKEALAGFVRTVAQDVVASGTQKALEPMAPPDRKVVHDTINEIDGVHTVSEGEDARRRVVIIPG